MNVLIATHEREELLARTLRSIAEAVRPPELEQIWIIENGTRDVARDISATFSEALPIRYEHHPQPGKSRALQSVLDRLRSGFVVFLDDDVRISRDCFIHYARAAAAHGPGHFFGGPLSVDYESDPPEWLNPFLPGSVKGWTPEQGAHLGPAETFLGANYGVFVEDLLAVGGFDPGLGPGAVKAGTEGNPTGQEREAQGRLRGAGVEPVYVPGARVWHYVPRDRCSPQWVLERRRRNATSTVLKTHAQWSARWWIGGVPAWVWTSHMSSLITLAVSMLIPDGPRRLTWRLGAYRSRGWIDGFRLVAHRHSHDALKSADAADK